MFTSIFLTKLPPQFPLECVNSVVTKNFSQSTLGSLQDILLPVLLPSGILLCTALFGIPGTVEMMDGNRIRSDCDDAGVGMLGAKIFWWVDCDIRNMLNFIAFTIDSIRL